MVVGLVHEHVSGEEHGVAEPPHENGEGEDEPEFPVLSGEDRDENSNEKQVKKELLTGLTVHF